MKKLYGILYAVTVLCVAGAAVFLILAPDRVPVHYDFAGKVDRIGSKYELLLFPLFSIAMGVFFRVVARQAHKRKEPANEKILLYAGVITLLFFTLLGLYFLIKAIRYDPGAAPDVSVNDVNRFTSIGVGVLLIVLGNYMPKARRNAAFGLRTKWSMADDAVWQKSQRFGGITLVIAGLVMILLSLFLTGLWNLLMMTLVIAAAGVLSVVASYRYSRAAQNAPPAEK